MQQPHAEAFFNEWFAKEGERASGAQGGAPDAGRHEPDPDWQPL